MYAETSLQGELVHRLVKRLYGLTNKKDAPEQITCQYRRAHHFKTSGSHDPSLGGVPLDGNHTSLYDSVEDSPEFHHAITDSRNDPIELASFSKTQDPATKVGLPLCSISVLTRPPEFYLQTLHPPPQPAPGERPQ